MHPLAIGAQIICDNDGMEKNMFPVRFRPFLISLIVFLFWSPSVFADPIPVVEQFTVSPSSINNDGAVVLTWTAGNTTGDDLYFACPAGVMITVGGGSFPCNTRHTYSSNMSDSGSFVVTNVSGSSQIIDVTVYPRDASGVDYDAGAMSTTFIVTTSPKPIKTFILSPQTVSSGMPVTLAWTGVDASGINFEFDCNSNIQISAVTTTGTSNLPCGGAAFTPDLAVTGTTTILVRDLSFAPTTIVVHAVPLIAAGTYDMTHALSASFTVDPASAQSQPAATSFSSKPASIVPGVPFTLSWATHNASGANIEFICNGPAVSAMYPVGTTTVSMPCDMPVFATALPPSGNTSISVAVVQTGFANTATFELLPEGVDGTYYATSARTLSIPIVSSVAAEVKPATTTTVSSASSTPPSWQHYNFTRSLHRGSQNADVMALQSYLALDPSLYPSGLVTGYFGAATEQAVELFQMKYQIATPGSSGYGLIGPLTRTTLNTLQ